jgi:hypothetical protein
MTILLTVLVLAILSYITHSIVTRYTEATGTPTERLWLAVRESATVAVGYASSAVLGLVALMSDAGFQDQIKTLIPTTYWPHIALAIAFLMILARKRTL